MKREVIIDTNGLMIPGQFGIDIFMELKRLGFDSYVVPRASVRELEKISMHGRGRDRTAAKIALSLMERCTIVEKGGFADDVIMELATSTEDAVLTSDIELKKRLCSKGVTIVQLREKTHLSL
ncbi:MAG: DNA-binding protein [Euryarchaeota archaeon]|nr:DNA-binding protein [Euryarchaeota archaeon]MBU4138439.1 DNA-binding protein [Euryarchaeota archaeon]